MVRQFVTEQGAFLNNSPGYQLLATLGQLFRATMPSTPPREGKRLDTNWGRFGILAALYFAPFEHGSVHPTSLLDAWGRIDQVLPLFVFEADHSPPATNPELYRLGGGENEAVPTSTLSDWHNRGLEHLVEALINRERLLGARLEQPSVILEPSGVTKAEIGGGSALLKSLAWRIKTGYRAYRRWIWAALALVVALFLGWNAWRMISLARAVKGDVARLQAIVDADKADILPEVLDEIGPLLDITRKDVLALREGAAPFLWIGRLLGWLPVYGGDLASAGDLLDLAAGVVIAGDEAYQSAATLLEGMASEEERPSIPEILDVLVAAQPRVALAQENLAEAMNARAKIDIEHLSPKTRPLVDKLDPYLPLLEDGLAALSALPKVMGASGYGPQTYLVLLQNEDELRATGGFITAVGVLTVENGEITAYTVEDSYAIDDLDQPTFTPPWQLKSYMLSGLWWIRDSNWSPDFPTAAAWAERMYSYSRKHAVDGVVALDQEAIRLLFTALGPITPEGYDKPVTAENIIAVMRQAKDPTKCSGLDPEKRRQCKDFLGPLAAALLDKLQARADLPWSDLVKAMFQALDERHVLLHLDDPAATLILAHRGWDGAMRPGKRDYLMVVDSNVGFNKMDAVVERRLEYAVDLSKLDKPRASITFIHHNPVAHDPGEAGCVHTSNYDALAGYAGLMAKCYWDYLRVYKPEGTTLTAAVVQFIPGEWIIGEELAIAQVDDLNAGNFMPEQIEGIQGFGMLLVVPRAETLETAFEFELPTTVVQSNNDGQWLYHLYIQKQPGIEAVSLALSVRLPVGAQIVAVEPDGTFQDDIWRVELDLSTDGEVSLRFRMP